MSKTQLLQQDKLFIGQFTAMASPCEVLMETTDAVLAQKLLAIASEEAWRIEGKFSRYKPDSVIWAINHAEGAALRTDPELSLLINFAEQCYQVSDGLFDITSGSLGHLWRFDGSHTLPKEEDIQQALERVGWHKVSWDDGVLQMPAGMQLDLGGIGKEYAVDRCLMLLQHQTDIPLLVNFGGDLAVTGSRHERHPWQVGIERPDTEGDSRALLEIQAGALATSGDAHRHLLVNNIRYSHILNPLTGWPIHDAPRSITVAGQSCLHAGMLATLGLLQGMNAENFLREQALPFWVLR